MISYVVGFCFSEDLSTVVLIHKQRPAWQNGLLNGVGGKIETGESSIAAMVREFEEETGVATMPSDWECVSTIESDEWWMYVFFCKSDAYVRAAQTTEEEEIVKLPVNRLYFVPTITNLRWLIPMMLDENVRRNVQHMNFRKDLE